MSARRAAAPAKAMRALRTKRAYDAPAASDGRRILIDRLWPRGLTKAKARIDHWARAIAPSNALRKWYAHDLSKWSEFKRRYFAELDANPAGVDALREQLGVPVTFVYGTRETERNNATALIEYLARRPKRAARPKAEHLPARRAKKRGVTWPEVRKLALSFPGISEGTSYGMHAFLLDGKFFSRFNEKEQGLVIHAEEPLRDALLAERADTFFTTDHYR
ncbi:MAG TPA: DUF488 family protein, partial [Myxococcota bacterium]|nr:DUF488 family protein [Myxococcota bacterium]